MQKMNSEYSKPHWQDKARRGGTHCVMVIVVGNGVQIPDETDCISHSTNTLGKGINPIIFPPAMGK